MRGVGRSVRLLAALVVGTAALAGCSSGGQHPDVTVELSASLFDVPVHIVVRGLHPGATVTLTLRSTDEQKTVWSSTATFRSDAAGTVDLATDPAVSGSYQGVDPMGLVDTLQPVPAKPAYYYWPRKLATFVLGVADGGHTVATKAFTRRGSDPAVRMYQATIAATGFYGQYWTPGTTHPARPAVLEFGGSDGGLSGSLIGAALASAGYPTLDLAYFAEPGLPSTLRDIPLAYFARALRWLAHQPGVLPDRIYVSGASRGSEAALLLGAHYPDLVHGVIASSPSDMSFGSVPDGRSPAWTFDGRPVPHSRTFSDFTAVDDPAALIPVAKIQGPVLLVCGTADQMWTSCAYAETIQDELAAAGDRFPHALYRYTSAGHYVNALVPYEPTQLQPQDADGLGDTYTANANADARFWPNLLHFLAGNDVRTGTFTAPAGPPPLTANR